MFHPCPRIFILKLVTLGFSLTITTKIEEQFFSLKNFFSLFNIASINFIAKCKGILKLFIIRVATKRIVITPLNIARISAIETKKEVEKFGRLEYKMNKKYPTIKTNKVFK